MAYKGTSRSRETRIAVFWSMVGIDLLTGCWPWRGGTAKAGGYGTFNWNGRQPMGAHRIVYELENGPIPLGMVVRHTCDNPPCVNPAHLVLGTNEDNRRDCAIRGRTPAGPDNWASKLTADQVRQIRTEYPLIPKGKGRMLYRHKFGVSYSIIYNVVHGISYRRLAQ